jgi:hypothetical protein
MGVDGVGIGGQECPPHIGINGREEGLLAVV